MSYSDWKIKVRGADQSVTASYILDFAKKDGSVSLFGLRRELTDSISDSEPLLKCEHCNNPIIISRKKESVFLKHQPSKNREQDDALFSCRFYKGKSAPIFDKEDKQESRINKFVKRVLMKCLMNYRKVDKRSIQTDPKLHDASGTGAWRSPDVYFKLNDGSQWAFEVINVWLNPQFIAEREHFYNKNNINLVWLIPEERLNTMSITYGDLMFGNDGHHNVFSFTFENIKRSMRENDLFITVHYPTRGKNNNVLIESREASFSEMKMCVPHGTPYIEPVNNIVYSDVRKYLLDNGLINFIRTDDELLIEARKSLTDDVLRLHTSTRKFIFNEGILTSFRDKARTINSRLDSTQREVVHKKLVKAMDRINTNIDMLNAIEQYKSSSDKSFEQSVAETQVFSVRRRLSTYDNHEEAQSFISMKLAAVTKPKFVRADKLPYLVHKKRITIVDSFNKAMSASSLLLNSEAPTVDLLLNSSYWIRVTQSLNLSNLEIEDQTSFLERMSAISRLIEDCVRVTAQRDIKDCQDDDSKQLVLLIHALIQFQKDKSIKLLSKDYLIKTEPLVLFEFITELDKLSWVANGYKNQYKKLHGLLTRYGLGLSPIQEQ